MVFAQIKTEERKEKKDERTENTLTQDDKQASVAFKENYWKLLMEKNREKMEELGEWKGRNDERNAIIIITA